MSAIEQWWAAAAEERLLVQRCRACGAHQHYPRPLCRTCHAGDVELVPAAGTGVVHSFTVIHRAPRPDLAVRYVVAIVELDEGPRLLTHVVDCPPDAVTCDMAVAVRWADGPDGNRLPVFAPRD